MNEKRISLTGSDRGPAYYTMLACVVGAVALTFVPETARASIRDRCAGRRHRGETARVEPVVTPARR